MLIRFSVRNYKVFKETATLSMVASNYFSESEENIATLKAGSSTLRLLKSAVIYGANASGKSKLLDALQFMREFVRSSSRESLAGENIRVSPFLLSTSTEQAPSTFEVVFVLDDIQYRYGFEASTHQVLTEWLYRKEFRVEVEVFTRKAQELTIHPQLFKKGRLIEHERLLRSNALLLSTAAQLNDQLAISLLNWFGLVRSVSDAQESGYLRLTAEQLKEEQKKQAIMELLEAADIGIKDLYIKEKDQFLKDMILEEVPAVYLSKILAAQKNEPEKTENTEVTSLHTKYDEQQLPAGSVAFSLEQDESAGTQKYFALLGPLLTTCEARSLLIADELDARLHPNLVSEIVTYFHRSQSNPFHSQLIFNTHNTNLLSEGLFRRDQIWFIQKDRYGASELYSLADFKKEGGKARKQENFEKNYLEGRYKGVPYLGAFEGLFVPQTP
ncbi:MAG: ATP-binding protein [Bacteroidetes bacterium]|nr:MAG: ATP-binding protein [Bacteroidota bacterium]